MKSQAYSNIYYCIDLNNHHLFKPRIEFLNEAKIYFKYSSSARIWSLYLHCLWVKEFPFVIVIAERGFPEVADWLTSVVIRSKVLGVGLRCGVVVWFKFEAGAVRAGRCGKLRT